MSASTASLNVLRWSALGLGLVYGLYHQSSLSSAQKTAEAKRQWTEQEKLIQKARAEFNKQNGSGSVAEGAVKKVEENLSFGDKGFDLDGFLKKV